MRTRRVFMVRRLMLLLLVIAAVLVAIVAVHRLTRSAPPPPAPRVERTTDVTIIPGHSRRQVQRLLNESGIPGSYLRATLRSPLLDPTQYGAPAGTPSLEGFMWPDTYNLRKPVKIKALVADQLTAFKEHFARVNLNYAKSKNLSAYDVLKIASLLTEESMKPGDAPKVASVIYNRLRMNMDLGLDSTVAYATGNYGDLTEKDLHSSSPWNTRNHPGLPPTPIDSPDLAAINAAAHPANTDYVYFINKVCGGGGCCSPPVTTSSCIGRRSGTRPWTRRRSITAAPSSASTAGREQARGPRLARLAQPLSGDAERGTGRCGARGTGITSCCPYRPSSSMRRSPVCPQQASAAPTSQFLTSRPRWPLRLTPAPVQPRSARRTRFCSTTAAGSGQTTRTPRR